LLASSAPLALAAAQPYPTSAVRTQLLAATRAYAGVATSVGDVLRLVVPARVSFGWASLNARALGIFHDSDDARALWRRAETIAATANLPLAEVEAINARAGLDLASGALETARDGATHARERAQAARDVGGEIEATLLLADSLRLLGSVNDAQQQAGTAAELARQIGDASLRSRALTLLAVLTKNKGDYLQGLQFEIEALRQEQAGADVQTQAIALAKLGKLYEQIEDNAQAIEYQERALRLAEGRVSADALAHILVGYANILNDISPDQHERALTYAKRALAIANETGNRTLEVDSELQVARAHFNAGAFGEAAQPFEHALANARAIGQRVSVAHVLLRQGELFEREGRLKEAIANSLGAIDIYRASDNLPRLIKCYAILERQLKANNDIAGATDARLNRFELRDRVLGASAMRGLAELEAKTLQESQRQQIELLQRQREIDALRFDRETLQRWLSLFFAVAAGCALLAMIWRFHTSTRVNRLLRSKNLEILDQQRALEASNNELRRSAGLLYTAANTDALTGCCNRARGVDLLRDEIEAARQSRSPLSLLLVDVDHFKQVNDRHGHLFGDRALCAVARLLGAGLRLGDTLVRFGGEEFLILLPCTALHDAISIADALRLAVERDSPGSDPHLSLTISVGACALSQFEDAGVEALLGSADQALYAAKHAGRNRVRIYRGLKAEA